MDYEYYYNSAKSRYYDACSNINSCENRRNEYINEKNRRINEINEVSAKLNKHYEALEQIENLIKLETDLNNDCTKIKNAVDEAGINFSGMVQSTDVTTKSLSDVYKDENTVEVGKIFDQIRMKKSNLSGRINELEECKRNAENNLANAESGIRTCSDDISHWGSVKSSASIDMEYYKRKMEEE